MKKVCKEAKHGGRGPDGRGGIRWEELMASSRSSAHGLVAQRFSVHRAPSELTFVDQSLSIRTFLLAFIRPPFTHTCLLVCFPLLFHLRGARANEWLSGLIHIDPSWSPVIK